MRLKGVWHEIFDLRFFSWIIVTWAPEYSIGAVSNFFKNSRRYSQMNVYHQCQRHWQWQRHRWTIIAGDNDTGEQNLLPVTRTRMPWRWGAAKDRRKLKGINRWYLRPPKPYTAANGVTGIAMESCIQRHSIHPDPDPEVILAASGASYQDV